MSLTNEAAQITKPGTHVCIASLGLVAILASACGGGTATTAPTTKPATAAPAMAAPATAAG